ncbi:hypothetical protein Ferpe_0590 [Fervidobacterium pennivorans DSM 9078]|uniref:Uncharacterized protein n=1 Tax=Fervidobacterium pennivorans (strain DSM 9078 / Ven5) TaxID=771875 RepID=H9UB27_FERPD|nr:hypothetical protein [Fervidobacterium pennivorans]AFG34720.1 hypothetical protein Ferpe_0590 [Fervidobacterium pennivorans DSM 9078]
MRKLKQALLYTISIVAIILWLDYSGDVASSIETLINGGKLFERSIGSPFLKITCSTLFTVLLNLL